MKEDEEMGECGGCEKGPLRMTTMVKGGRGFAEKREHGRWERQEKRRRRREGECVDLHAEYKECARDVCSDIVTHFEFEVEFELWQLVKFFEHRQNGHCPRVWRAEHNRVPGSLENTAHKRNDVQEVLVPRLVPGVGGGRGEGSCV